MPSNDNNDPENISYILMILVARIFKVSVRPVTLMKGIKRGGAERDRKGKHGGTYLKMRKHLRRGDARYKDEHLFASIIISFCIVIRVESGKYSSHLVLHAAPTADEDRGKGVPLPLFPCPKN